MASGANGETYPPLFARATPGSRRAVVELVRPEAGRRSDTLRRSEQVIGRALAEPDARWRRAPRPTEQDLEPRLTRGSGRSCRPWRSRSQTWQSTHAERHPRVFAQQTAVLSSRPRTRRRLMGRRCRSSLSRGALMMLSALPAVEPLDLLGAERVGALEVDRRCRRACVIAHRTGRVGRQLGQADAPRCGRPRRSRRRSPGRRTSAAAGPAS